MASAVGKCAFLLGSMHVEGFAHSDAQVKNMFVSNHLQPFIADFEKLRVFRKRNGQYDPFDAHDKAQSDLLTLSSSIHHARPELFDEAPYLAEIIFGIVYTAIISKTAPEGRVQFNDVVNILKDPHAYGMQIA